MIEALLVMMNNYFHDLAVGFLFASCVMAHAALRRWPEAPAAFVGLLRQVAWGSRAWVIVGGAVRAWFYREYEWLEKAGTAQVPALAAKHVLLFALTAWGIWGILRLSRQSRGEPEA